MGRCERWCDIRRHTPRYLNKGYSSAVKPVELSQPSNEHHGRTRPEPFIRTLASGLGFTKSTAAFSMSALPVAITVAMIRPPQPSHDKTRFKMSIKKWCHARVPKNGVSRSKRVLKPQPLPHQHWGLELRTSLTGATTMQRVEIVCSLHCHAHRHGTSRTHRGSHRAGRDGPSSHGPHHDAVDL